MRLDAERQKELEPKRLQFAKSEIERLGYKLTYESSNMLRFDFKGKPVVLYVYSGWHTGATITDGRGIEKLIKQIK